MKRKTTFLTKALTLLIVVLFSLTGARAETLTVYENATGSSDYVPVYGFWADAYNKCEFVIAAAELTGMVGGTISQMTFYLSTNASEAWTGTFQVFLKEVEESTISTFSGTDEAIFVYEGSLDGTHNTMPIEFTSDYTYEGGNLLVGVYQTVKGNWKSASFTGQTVTGASVSGYSSNSLGDVNPTQRNFVPKTTFTYTPSSGVVYYRPKNLKMEEITTNTATMSWTVPASEVTGYTYQYKKATEDDDAWSAEETTTATSVTLTSLYAATAYNFRVKAIYAGGESKYVTINFTTDCGIVFMPFTEGFEYGIPCWTLVNKSTENADKIGIMTDQHHGGSHSFRFSSYDRADNYNQYLISPEFDGSMAVAVEFYYKAYGYGDGETFKVGYSVTTNEPDAFTWGEEVTTNTTDWTKYEESFPKGTKYVAINYYSDYQYYLYVDDFNFTPDSPVDVTISYVGYGTLYYSNLNLKVPEGVEAYTYSYEAGNNRLSRSHTYRKDDVIPAGEPVALKAAPGTYNFYHQDGFYRPVEQNLLKGTDVAGLTTGGNVYYALAIKKGSNDPSTIGFYWMEPNGAAFNIGAHKAYLALDQKFTDMISSVTGVKDFVSLSDEEDPTGINEVEFNFDDDEVIYNLAGQRIQKMQKGINIVNGKKVLF